MIAALEGTPVTDPRISDYSMMKEFKWTYQELLDTPFHVIMSIGFIKESVKAHKKMEDLKKGEKET